MAQEIVSFIVQFFPHFHTRVIFPPAKILVARSTTIAYVLGSQNIVGNIKKQTPSLLKVLFSKSSFLDQSECHRVLQAHSTFLPSLEASLVLPRGTLES